jgi:hypothetical protein
MLKGMQERNVLVIWRGWRESSLSQLRDGEKATAGTEPIYISIFSYICHVSFSSHTGLSDYLNI